MKTELFKKETSRKIHLFFTQFKLFKYKKHERIAHADDIIPGVFYLKKGCARIYSISKDGEELTLVLYKPRNIFPLTWIIGKPHFKYHLEAMTDVELWRAPKEKFLEFLHANPDVLFELFKRVLARFGGVMERMEYLVFGDAYQKVASILLILADRFGKKDIDSIKILVPLTHKDIAGLLGITRETATLEIGKLKKKGIIEYRGRMITIKNIKKLQTESLLSVSSLT